MAIGAWLCTLRIMTVAWLTGGRVSWSGQQPVRDKGKRKNRRPHENRRPRGESRPESEHEPERDEGRREKELLSVPGVDLEARLEEAVRQGSASQSRFWAAYSFPARRGVCIDNLPEIENPIIHDLFAGRGPGAEAQTPAGTRAALFLEYRPEGGGARTLRPARAELESLRGRSAEQVAAGVAEASEPVYWLGQAEAEESIALLRHLIDICGREHDQAAARLTDAVALHEEEGGRVNSLLEELARGAAATGARLRAVAWLGRTSGEESFVLEVARDRGQPTEVRRAAVRALVRGGEQEVRGGEHEVSGGAGVSSPPGGAPHGGRRPVSLRQLYETVDDRELKAEIIMAAPKRKDKQEVLDFLRGVAREEPDAALRERARWRINSKKVTGPRQPPPHNR